MKIKKCIGIFIAFVLGVFIATVGEDVSAQVKSLIGKKVTGEYTVVVNGKTLSDKGAVIEGRTNVPVRALSEAIGADIKVDNKTISVMTEEKEPTDKVVMMDGLYYNKYELLNKKTSIERSIAASEADKEKDFAEYNRLKESGQLEGYLAWEGRLNSYDKLIEAKKEQLAKVNEALKAFE